MTRSNLVGLLIRNSTVKQVGNYRSEYQYAMADVIKRRGFSVRAYDEQGTSGKDLSARAITLRMLKDVDTGELGGIGAEDFKRLTRDEFGIDGGIIAKRLAKAGALFHTRDKVYDLRNEDDLLQFQFQCFLSGIDWRNIRNTFWSGVIKAWEKGPIIARRPLGYYSIPLEEPGRARPRMIPAKNPDHAAVMAELVVAFDECKTMQGVIRHLRNAGVKRPAVKYRGKIIEGWTANGLRDMLDNKTYQGIFESGGDTWRDGTTERSIVWRKFASDPDSGQVKKFTQPKGGRRGYQQNLSRAVALADETRIPPSKREPCSEHVFYYLLDGRGGTAWVESGTSAGERTTFKCLCTCPAGADAGG